MIAKMTHLLSHTPAVERTFPTEIQVDPVWRRSSSIGPVAVGGPRRWCPRFPGTELAAPNWLRMPIWRALAVRAVATGRTLPAEPETTNDPGPYRMAAGRRLAPASVPGGRQSSCCRGRMGGATGLAQRDAGRICALGCRRSTAQGVVARADPAVRQRGADQPTRSPGAGRGLVSGGMALPEGAAPLDERRRGAAAERPRAVSARGRGGSDRAISLQRIARSGRNRTTVIASKR
jgi:hypothetical protein